ncbi:MAG: AAA family ATPase [Mycoplasmataceae bacterium]|nr:AAA family ATPase [Mycoplasmataceae bacterium]
MNVITGIRRCGKTTLLLQFIEELKKSINRNKLFILILMIKKIDIY